MLDLRARFERERQCTMPRHIYICPNRPTQPSLDLESIAGKLPSSLISVEYMHLYSMHDFNRLMSAMSIDGIWQNNLIYFEIRQNAASHFGIHIRIQEYRTVPVCGYRSELYRYSMQYSTGTEI